MDRERKNKRDITTERERVRESELEIMKINIIIDTRQNKRAKYKIDR